MVPEGMQELNGCVPGSPGYKYCMRINEDYMDVIDRDEIINSDLSMNINDNVVWLLNGQPTNIDFNLIYEPIYKVKTREEL